MTLDEIADGLARVKGVLATAIVDYGSGMIMSGRCNAPELDLEVLAAGCVNILNAKLRVLQMTGLNDSIHDIQINLSSQYHLISPARGKENALIYRIADRQSGDLPPLFVPSRTAAALICRSDSGRGVFRGRFLCARLGG